MKNNKNDNYYLAHDANFSRLCELTLAVLNLNEFPDGTFTEEGNGWLELAEAWEKHSEFGSAGIFLEAVHRIMWGIPSDGCDSDYEEIIRIVVEELQNDGEAFETWNDYDACSVAIKAIENDTTPWVENCDDYRRSIEHYCYLRNKMLWKIRYSKAKYAAEVTEYKQAVLAYEAAIMKIIPEAESWDEAYWYNERHIYDELIKLYGIDYRDDYVEYGRILLILMNDNKDKFVYDLEEAWFASNIRRMPMSLAKVIWPDDTEDKILEMFLWAAEAAESQLGSDNQDEYAIRKDREIHPVGVFEYSALRDSWLFNLVYEWYYDYHGNDEVSNEIKKKVFSVALHK